MTSRRADDNERDARDLRSVVRRNLKGVVILGLTMLVAASAATLTTFLTPPETRPTAPPALVERARAIVVDSVTELARRNGSADRQFFARSVWKSGDPGCWQCDLGPGTAAAVAAARGTEDAGPLARVAIQTFDRALADQARPDGAFGRPPSLDIQTMFFGVELATAYLELGPRLDAPRRNRWRAAIVRAGDYLVRNGNLRWYTNGNVNLGNAELFQLAWLATGKPRFRSAYEEALTFALHPAQSRWPGYGLRLVRAPTRADGSNGAGFLAESGGGAPGFDAEYAQLQLDIAARLWLAGRDKRVLRLMNLLTNVLLARVDSDWLLDTSQGTRKPERGRKVPFLSPGLAVLAWAGGRDDLRPRVAGQLERIEQEYRGALSYSHRNLYRGLSTQVGVLLQAAERRASSPAARSAR